MATTFVSAPHAPENVHRFAPATGPIADLFERFLAVERLVGRPFQDDLRLGERFAATPPPPRTDRPAAADDDEGDEDDGSGPGEANLQEPAPLRVP